MFRLDGQVAIVTGGSRGLGAGIAAGLLEAGASVLIVSRNPPESSTDGVVHHAADLSHMESVTSTLTAALDRFGRVDILVNNAGLARRAPTLEHTEEDWDYVLATNLKIPFFLAQACARHFIEQKRRGKIINVSSIMAYLGGYLAPSYTASKHGLAGITKAMANELAPHGINVNALAPGFYRTDMTTYLDSNRAYADWLLSRIPQGRFGEPRDLAGAAVFLASSASDYLQGHLLVVDGGMLGR